MTVQLTITPSEPSVGDGIMFEVEGSFEDTAQIVVTGAGDSEQRSPEFGQTDSPEGTGADKFSLTIYGGTGGTFTIEVYDHDDGERFTTDPIYYHNDGSAYTYPDADDVKDALEDAVDGLEATVTKEGPTLTVLLGGKYAGRDMAMNLDVTSITGSETATSVDSPQSTGPFRWGPIYLEDGDYEVDVILVSGDDADDSILDDTVVLTVEE